MYCNASEKYGTFNRKQRVVTLSLLLKSSLDNNEICFPNQLHRAWFFVKRKCPNNYSVHLSCTHIDCKGVEPSVEETLRKHLLYSLYRPARDIEGE